MVRNLLRSEGVIKVEGHRAGVVASAAEEESIIPERPGYVVQRTAPRVSGEGWQINISEAESDYRVLNVSRAGVCIEGPHPMKVDGQYSLKIVGPNGPAVIDFSVVRCSIHHQTEVAPVYRIAGMFNRELEREDLPARS